MKPTVKISQRRTVPNFRTGDGFVLMGMPENHPGATVSNIKLIVTSPIVAEDFNGGWIETMNTRYILVGPPASLDDIRRLMAKAFSTPPMVRAETVLQ